MSLTLRHQDQITVLVISTAFFVMILFLSIFEKDFESKLNREYRFQVNINTATAEELQTLPGIGEKLAEAIVLYREKRHSFNAQEEILNVRGIGVKKFEAIKPHLLEIQAEKL